MPFIETVGIGVASMAGSAEGHAMASLGHIRTQAVVVRQQHRQVHQGGRRGTLAGRGLTLLMMFFWMKEYLGVKAQPSCARFAT
jgi:hypothetical protein